MARILIVDDHEATAYVLSSVLRHRGHTPVTATSGEAGIELIDGEPPFDLVILDNHMPPGMSGLEVLGRIAGPHARPWPPVIMYSATPLVQYEATRLGAVAFVSKSDPAILLDAIAQHLPV